ncbi:MAG: HAD family phosphatase [Candidatus Micrarchaeota archaeon]|nr:HAD family phosphatase [Candidatus Micrarchaeota archaeon]
MHSASKQEPSIKAAIFDLDGVVVQSEEAHRRTFNKIFSRFGFQVGKAYWKKNYTGIGSRAVMKDAFARHSVNASLDYWVRRRAAAYRRYVRRHGLPLTKGFRSFLRFLERNKVKVAIASGGERKNIYASLCATGLERLKYVGADDIRRGKPNPEIFLLAASRLKVPPGSCLVFEDSLAGLEAAQRANMRAVALATSLPRKELLGKALLVVGDFRQKPLFRLVEKLALGR